LDRNIRVAYDSDGFIESVTDFTGRQLRYTHYKPGDVGSFGDLMSVISPDVIDPINGNDFPHGKTNLYTYNSGQLEDHRNHMLLTITDGKGQTWLQNTYSSPGEQYCDRVVRQVWGYANEVLRYYYAAQTPSAGNGFAVTKAIVNDRMGNVSE